MSNEAELPDGLHTVTPYFTLADADRFMAFITTVFGASVIKEVRDAGNQISHARLQIGDSIVMLNSAGESYEENVSQMHVFVEDADAIYEHALALGAVSIMEPNDRPHGDRMAGIKDPTGNIWWIATHTP